MHSLFRNKDWSSTIALTRSTSFLRSFTRSNKQNALCLGYKYLSWVSSGRWWQPMSCSHLSKSARDLLLFSQRTVHQAWAWAVQLNSWDQWQSPYHLKEFELGWVRLCLYPRQGFHVLFPVLDFQRKKKVISKGNLWKVSEEAEVQSA